MHDDELEPHSDHTVTEMAMAVIIGIIVAAAVKWALKVLAE